MPRLCSIAFAGAVALLAACRENTAPVKPPLPTLEDALSLVDAAHGFAAAGAVITGVPAPPGSLGTSSCEYDAERELFRCDPVEQGGITATRSYQLLDVMGAAQSTWGPGVTAIRTLSDLEGTLTLAGLLSEGTIDLASRDDATLNGLRSGNVSLKGFGASSWTEAGAGGANSWSSTRVIDLVVPRPGSAKQYPTGIIAMTSSVVGTSTAGTIVLSYDGTPSVKVTFTLDGVTQICALDLRTNGVSCASNAPASVRFIQDRPSRVR